MHVADLFRGLPVRIEGANVDVRALRYDSRRVQPGDLFAAFVGAASDGHRFVADAMARGATAILCEHSMPNVSATCIVAEDARHALAQAARALYGDPSQALSMVGITGTNGKTTTAHLVQAVIEAAGRPCGVIGTLGASFAGTARTTGMTTPESVDLVELIDEMRRAGARAVAMEVSSHALVQKRAHGLRFDVGVFATFSQDHLDFHGDMATYFAAKRRLFDELLKSNGRAVLNVDDPQIATLAGPGALRVGLGTQDLDLTVTDRVMDRDGLRLSVRTPRGAIELRTTLRGRFNALNVLLAVGTGVALELDLDAIVGGIERVRQVPGRFEVVSRRGEPQVIVDYAHTPDALAQALATARELTTGRLLCVFGCGGDRDRGKRPLMGEVAAGLADWVLITSDNPRSEAPDAIAKDIEQGLLRAGAQPSVRGVRQGYAVELDRAAAIRQAISEASEHDTVLIAGKGHETYQIVGGKTSDFDDRVQARCALDEVTR